MEAQRKTQLQSQAEETNFDTAAEALNDYQEVSKRQASKDLDIGSDALLAYQAQADKSHTARVTRLSEPAKAYDPVAHEQSLRDLKGEGIWQLQEFIATIEANPSEQTGLKVKDPLKDLKHLNNFLNELCDACPSLCQYFALTTTAVNLHRHFKLMFDEGEAYFHVASYDGEGEGWYFDPMDAEDLERRYYSNEDTKKIVQAVLSLSEFDILKKIEDVATENPGPNIFSRMVKNVKSIFNK